MAGTFETLEIRLMTDGDLVCAVVAGAHSPALRVQVSTLLDVFA